METKQPWKGKSCSIWKFMIKISYWENLTCCINRTHTHTALCESSVPSSSLSTSYFSTDKAIPFRSIPFRLVWIFSPIVILSIVSQLHRLIVVQMVVECITKLLWFWFTWASVNAIWIQWMWDTIANNRLHKCHTHTNGKVQYKSVIQFYLNPNEFETNW